MTHEEDAIIEDALAHFMYGPKPKTDMKIILDGKKRKVGNSL